MLRKRSTDEFICEELLEMMETVPFSKVKVTEFWRFADISRSAFYAHFDSIYDVIQKIEDDYFAGLIAAETFVEAYAEPNQGVERTRALIDATSNYLKENLRTYRSLTGENGEPAFTARMKRRVRSTMTDIFDETATKMDPRKKKLIVEYCTGGQLAAMSWMAGHADEMDADAIFDFTMDVIVNEAYRLAGLEGDA